MKQREKCSGRRFNSAHLHQKQIASHLIGVDDPESAFDGGVQVSTGQRVTEWTAQ